ncbi:hypothetical protein DIPPA_22308 [Diplonema papillatum]|nr:hypothetical protein DIPPA_22308 [Diplonema papillatum]
MKGARSTKSEKSDAKPPPARPAAAPGDAQHGVDAAPTVPVPVVCPRCLKAEADKRAKKASVAPPHGADSEHKPHAASAAMSDFIAGFGDDLLLRRVFVKLRGYPRFKDKQRLEGMANVLQNHMVAMQKTRQKLEERQKAAQGHQKNAAELTGKLQEATMKATYAEENFLMDQMEAEAAALRGIEKEIHRGALQRQEDIHFCKGCLREMACTFVDGAPPAAFKLAGADPSGGQTPAQRKELVVVKLIHNLRVQLEILDRGCRIREDHAKEMRGMVESMFKAYTADCSFNKKLASILVFKESIQAFAPVTKALKTNTVAVRLALKTVKTEVESTVSTSNWLFARVHQTMKRLLDTITLSAAHPDVLLRDFDSFYERFKADATSVEWPQCVSSALRVAKVTFTKLSGVDLTQYSEEVLRELRERYGEVNAYVSALITEVLSVTKHADTVCVESGLRTSKAEKALCTNKIELADAEAEVKRLRARVALLERQLQLERAFYDRVPNKGTTSSLELGSLGSSKKLNEAAELALEENRRALEGLTAAAMKSVGTSTPKRFDDSSMTVIFSLCTDTSDVGTNTVLLVTSGTQTDDYRRYNTTAGHRHRGESVGVQTEDFDFLSVLTQTDSVETQDQLVGPVVAEIGTVTEFDVMPGHVDGIATTTTTFCLAPSKYGHPSKAYTEIQYVCVDTQADEESPEPVVTLSAVNFAIARLRSALHSTFRKVDTLRQLLLSFQQLQAELLDSSVTRTPSPSSLPTPPSFSLPPEHVDCAVPTLPKVVADAVRDTVVYDKSVALLYVPSALAPTPPADLCTVYTATPTRQGRRRKKQAPPSHTALVRAERRKNIKPVTLPELTYVPLTTRV